MVHHQVIEQPGFLRCKAIWIWPIPGGERGLDILLQFISQLTLVVEIPFLQRLPKTLHGVVAGQELGSGGAVHPVPVVGIDFIKEAVALTL